MTKDTGVPEDMFDLPKNMEPGLPIDSINCTLVRADAILNLLMSRFDGTSDDRRPDSVICHALWAIQGELGLLKKMVIHGYETEGKV